MKPFLYLFELNVFQVFLLDVSKDIWYSLSQETAVTFKMCSVDLRYYNDNNTKLTIP